MSTVRQDLRFAWRRLLRQPRTSLTVVLLLGLAIGGVTSIFTVLNAVLLEPLPFPEPGELLVVKSLDESKGETISVSYPDFLDWRAESRSFEELAAMTEVTLEWRGRDRAEFVPAELVSANFFRLLGAVPLAGRFFLPEDDAPQAAPVAVLSARFWRTRRAADPGVVGETIRLNGQSYTVVGVAPEGFRGYSGDAEIWVPFAMIEKVAPRFAAWNLLSARQVRWHEVLGRLAEGTDLERARAEMTTLAGRLAAAHPDSNQGRGIALRPAREEILGDLGWWLGLLLAGAGLVLLVACANLSGLLLAQLERRRRELAVRLAIGGRPGQVMRQLLIENLLLAFAAGALGILLAVVARGALVEVLPLELPAFAELAIDARVLVFAFVLALLTGLLVGVLPALRVTRVSLVENLKQGLSKGGTLGRFLGAGRLVVAAQIALVLMLMAGSGLLLKSLWNLSQVDLGFVPGHVVTLRLQPPAERYGEEETRLLARQLEERLAGLPGVEGVGLTDYLFFSGKWMSVPFEVEGAAPAGDEENKAYRHVVSPSYFTTLGIPLLRGRVFDARDSATAAPVAIVSRRLAERYWPNGDALGRRLSVGADPGSPWHEIVGIAGDVRHHSLRAASPDPDVYLPLEQMPVTSLGVVARVAGDPEALFPVLREEIRQIDATIPTRTAASLEETLAEENSATRTSGLLLSLFALLALALATLGIYGTLAARTAERRKEIAIRLCLGATRHQVMTGLVREGLSLALVGMLLGLLGVLGASRLLASMTYRVSPTDPAVLSAVVLVLALIAAAAAFFPARRASRRSLQATLREE